MVLTSARLLAFTLLATLLGLAMTPAFAHKDHDKQQRPQAELSAQPSSPTPGAMHEMREDHAAAMAADAPKSFMQRIMSWAGRTHPFAVHFPIALFPVALVALVLARRRGETVELIRSLIIVAGGASVIAGVLGWLSGGFALSRDDGLHFWHRWIGTGLAIVGAALAFWAYRRRDSVFSRTMVLALAAITVVLLVQGWLGAALVHGMDHLNF
jgi:uncharacterized membrane protein